MAKGIGSEYNKVLNALIDKQPAKGVYVSALRLLFSYHVKKQQLDLPMASSIFTPLTEMYLAAKGTTHEMSKNRTGVYFSGVGYRNEKTRELVEVLTLGIENSSETANQADELYKQVFT